MSSMYSNRFAKAAARAAVGTGYYSGFDVAIAASTPKSRLTNQTPLGINSYVINLPALKLLQMH